MVVPVKRHPFLLARARGGGWSGGVEWSGVGVEEWSGGRAPPPFRCPLAPCHPVASRGRILGHQASWTRGWVNF